LLERFFVQQTNSLGEHPIKGLPQFVNVPFHRVMSGSAPPERLRTKSLFLADGRRIHSVKTKWGGIKAHRLLVQSLLALMDDLETRRP
jgi:hypothetical protein